MFCFLNAQSVLNVIQSPIAVPNPNPAIDVYFSPFILISKNGTGISFTYDATSHLMNYAILPSGASNFGASGQVFTSASDQCSAFIDENNNGALCTSTTSGQIQVRRFALSGNDLIFGPVSILGTSEGSSPIVCSGGGSNLVIGWKTKQLGNYYIGMCSDSNNWNILSPIVATQGYASDFCLVGNGKGEAFLIWNNAVDNNSNHGQYYSQRINVNNQSLDPPMMLPGGIYVSGNYVYQYEGKASMNDNGDVLFSWTDGETNTKSLIRCAALSKDANGWSNLIVLQPNPPQGQTNNYQRTSVCSLNNFSQGSVVWEYRTGPADNQYVNCYVSNINLNGNSISATQALAIPNSLKTPYTYIDSYGNSVITYNGNSQYNITLLPANSSLFLYTTSLGEVTPNAGEPAMVTFTKSTIQYGLSIFEDSTKHNTYASRLALFSSYNALKYMLLKSSNVSYEKGS